MLATGQQVIPDPLRGAPHPPLQNPPLRNRKTEKSLPPLGEVPSLRGGGGRQALPEKRFGLTAFLPPQLRLRSAAPPEEGARLRFALNDFDLLRKIVTGRCSALWIPTNPVREYSFLLSH